MFRTLLFLAIFFISSGSIAQNSKTISQAPSVHKNPAESTRIKKTLPMDLQLQAPDSTTEDEDDYEQSMLDLQSENPELAASKRRMMNDYYKRLKDGTFFIDRTYTTTKSNVDTKLRMYAAQEEAKKKKVLLLQPKPVVSDVTIKNMISDHESPDPKTGQLRRFRRIKFKLAWVPMIVKHKDGSTERIKKIVKFRDMPFVQISICPYEYADDGRILDTDETDNSIGVKNYPCVPMEGGKYFSLASLDLARQVDEFNKEAGQATIFAVTFAATWYLAGAGTSAAIAYLGYVPEATFTTDLFATTISAARHMVYGFIVGIPIGVFSNEFSVRSLDIMGLHENNELYKIFEQYEFTKYKKYEDQWQDGYENGTLDGGMYVYDNDEYLSQFQRVVHGMLNDNYKRHDEICKDCWIHCLTEAERLKNALNTFVGGLGYTPPISSQQDNFYQCDASSMVKDGP